MFFHISLLIEPSIAVFEFANKGLFHGMNSQMIEKVMPLPKYFVTVFMRTTKQSYYSSKWLKTSEFKYIELRCLRCIMSLYGTQIKILPFQYNNWILLIV